MNANLSIVINTNAAQAAQSMSSFGADAKQAITSTQSDVERFRQSMIDAAAANEVAARRFQSAMEAANDAVIGKAHETKAAMEDVAKATDNISGKGFVEKMSAAFGAAFGAGYAATQEWLQKTEDYVVAKGKAIAIGLAVAAVSAVAAAVYTAYQVVSSTVNFIEGLFTGDSMRSKAIDALVATNNQVQELRHQLTLSAVEAAALQDALGRLGVDKSGYVQTYTQAAAAMRANTDELERLGVQYKDSNGQLLTQAQFLSNVKSKLDEYKDGYDRSAAAAAIGAGSYLQVVAALKVTEAQIAQSKARLDDYNLGIGSNTQAAVERYQQAMRDFESETQKTTAGFSRVIADSFMPMATAMAEWLKNGFPTAVMLFRGAVATASTLVYGFATSVGMAFEAIVGTAESMVTIVVGAVQAAGKAFTGDFSGAKMAMADALDAAKERMSKTGEEMVAIAVKNNANMRAAWAMDGRDQPLADARAETALQGAGKAWQPAAKPEPQQPIRLEREPFTRYMEELDRMNVKLEQSEYSMMRVRAAQEAVRQKGLDLASAMDQANAAIDRIQRTESQRAVDLFTNKLELENDAYQQQTNLLGLTAEAQDLAAVAIKRHMEAQQAINEAKKMGKPLDDQALADLRANTDAQIDNMQALVRARQEMSRSAEFGQMKAFQEYTNNATNQAAQVKSAWSNAFRGMEDAFITFTRTGKVNLSSLVDQVFSDLVRIQFQRNLMGPIATSLGGLFGGQYTPGSSSFVGPMPQQEDGGGFFSGLMSSLPKFAVGTPYVPRDMLAMVHEGEAITPKGANTGINVQIVNNTAASVSAASDGQGGLQVLIEMVTKKVKSEVARDVTSGGGEVSNALSSTYGLNRAAGAY